MRKVNDKKKGERRNMKEEEEEEETRRKFNVKDEENHDWHWHD